MTYIEQIVNIAKNHNGMVTAKMYRAFGLNDRQLQILTQATSKKEYYYVSELGCRLYDLDLEPETLGIAWSISRI